ncbi:MAG: hypothetical protein WCL11_07480 [Verrucomicrobiota bacterium]
MKLLTFTVQVRAEFYDHQQIGRHEAAHLLCQDINTILTKYDGSTGSAQLIHGPRNIKVTDSKAPGSRATKNPRKPGRRCRACRRPERIHSIGGIRLSNISPQLGLCAPRASTPQ